MGVSSDILTLLRDSMSAYVNDDRVVYERYRLSLQDLEAQNYYPFARVSMYDLNENVNQRIDDYRACSVLTNYGIDISVRRAYQNLTEEDSELLLLDLKDKVIDWMRETDFAALTDVYLNYLGYTQNTGIIRNTRYATMTLSVVAQKDVHKTQFTTIT
jgi:hypothetical protein